MTNIIDTSALSTHMGKTLTSSIATQVVAAVNAFIETRTHRCWGEVKTVTERYDFKSPLWLRHQDISLDVSTPITVKLGYPNLAQQTIAPTGYFANAQGRLTLFFSSSSRQSVRNNDLLEVTYSYGVLTAAVPSDLIEAALGIGQRLYNFVTNDGKDIVASHVGSYQVESINAIRSAGNGSSNSANNTAELLFGVVDSHATKRF